MGKKNMLSPTILIDFKKNRIRIHQCTMQWMKNPECFRFLVNPEKHIIALQTCDISDLWAHRSHVKQGAGQSLEIYSHALLQQLSHCSQWEAGKIYKLTGFQIPQDGTIFFQMEDAITISKNYK